MKVRTQFIFPPIPVRRFDWTAVDDETYEAGFPVGFGATEAEAVADLLEQLGVPAPAPVPPATTAGEKGEG